jgi:hypothetical protein
MGEITKVEENGRRGYRCPACSGFFLLYRLQIDEREVPNADFLSLRKRPSESSKSSPRRLDRTDRFLNGSD